MSLVIRAGSVPRSRLATLFFLKILMCSYERPGWPGEISVFATEISVTGMKIFPYVHSSSVTGTKHF